MGETSILFYPHGERPDGNDWTQTGPAFQYLQSQGFRVFCSVGTESFSYIKKDICPPTRVPTSSNHFWVSAWIFAILPLPSRICPPTPRRLWTPPSAPTWAWARTGVIRQSFFSFEKEKNQKKTLLHQNDPAPVESHGDAPFSPGHAQLHHNPPIKVLF